MRFGLTRHIWTLNSWPLPPFSEQCFHARPLPPPPYTLLPIVQQQFLFSLPTHQSNKVESLTNPKQWPTFSITWTKKEKKYPCNSPFKKKKKNLPPPIHTLTSHEHLIDCELSSHTKAVRNITLLFFRWPNAFWIWCFNGKDSSLFTGCKMLSITQTSLRSAKKHCMWSTS